MGIKRGSAETTILEHMSTVQLQPNYNELSRATGINTTTLWEAWRRMVADGRIHIIVEIREEHYQYRKVQG